MYARRVASLLTLTLALAACSFGGAPELPPAATPAPTAEQAPSQPVASNQPPTQVPPSLYLAIIWHQHQPVYYKDPATNVYAKPWVRLHAAKDYVDMAQTLQKYPNVHVTFNLTPSLLRQLRDIEGGARDSYWVATQQNAANLTPDDKRFILRHFFDANPKIIARFPRFAALRAMRGDDTDDAALDRVAAGWTAADFRDLQVLFNLGWTDPDWLAQPQLRALVEKREGYSEDDKQVVLNRQIELVKEVIPLHAGMQETGQIEVTMTPYAHPILPLLVSTDAAAQALPDAKLPKPPFIYGQDAQAQVEQGVALYKELFGRTPRGMWPAEGSVSQLIVPMVARAGLKWMASDEGVLAKSLGVNQFNRDSRETVQTAEQLYQPYLVGDDRGNQLAMLFRDRTLSDKVGFTYSGQSGDAASSDFIARLRNIQAALKDKPGPHLVTVILDGENAWENYDNDGKAFLSTLYQKLNDDPAIKTVTPSEYLAQFPPHATIADLWGGSWINADYSTWIGEPEENKAWDLLNSARETLQKYIAGVRTADPATLKKAQDLMYVAEGSDWFWWYGTDQDSGDDASFDAQFRDTLREMYTTLGAAPPDALLVPIVAAKPIAPTAAPSAAFTPTIDGQVAPGEWDAAGRFTISGGVAQSGNDVAGGLLYGFDAKNLYVRIDARNAWRDLGPDGTIGVYLSTPAAAATTPFARFGTAGQRTLLGFDAGTVAELRIADGNLSGQAMVSDTASGGWGSPRASIPAAVGDTAIELAIPLTLLGQFEAGDSLNMRVVASRAGTDVQTLPATSHATVLVPDLGLSTTILDITDPAGDDHGPGSYSYPQDQVFTNGVFDLTNFTVAEDATNLIFKLTVKGGIDNVWNSPRGLAVQTFDIYIDTNDQASSSRLLFPGRNAAFQSGQGWNYGLWIEGWEGGLYKADPKGAPQQVGGVELKTTVEGATGRVTIRLPKSALPAGDPQTWRYMAAVLGQEGFPSAGVWRVRDIAPTAQQWRFGGALPGTNGTRIIDLALPAEASPAQEELLKPAQPAQETNLDQLGPDDFAQVPLLGAK